MNFQRLNCQHILQILRPLQASMIASAALLMLPATAQMPAPAPTSTSATSAAHMPPPAQRMQGKHHRAGPRAAQGMCMQNCTDHQRSAGGAYGAEPANADRLVNDRPRSVAEYERNAFARCDVFKNQTDHRACMERVQRPAQGSVQSGGLLREYSYEVPAEPR